MRNGRIIKHYSEAFDLRAAAQSHANRAKDARVLEQSNHPAAERVRCEADRLFDHFVAQWDRALNKRRAA